MEIWKDIKGFEGLYQVSNFGRVKSVDRLVDGSRGKRKIKSRIMKEYKNQFGYCMISLSKYGKSKQYSIHRLVAEEFIPNISELPQVNHIDGNKENNRADNLEWITNRDNVIHAYKNNLRNTIRIDKDMLIDLYINKKYPVYKIAKMINVSQGTIRKNLKDYGIEIRSYQGSKKKYNIEKEFLKKELESKNLSQIAREIGCSFSTINLYKEKYNL